MAWVVVCGEHDMEELFAKGAHIASTLVEAAAVLIVFYGALESFGRLLWIVANPSASHGERKALWRRFGVWLLLGLEFELAADIIGSVISPTWMDIGELGAIAVIRTFLNYFLEKDLEHSEESREPVPDAVSIPSRSARPAPAG
jgi:uncharacterized membrane protein